MKNILLTLSSPDFVLLFSHTSELKHIRTPFYTSTHTLWVKEYFRKKEEFRDKFLEVSGGVWGCETPRGLHGVESSIWDVKVTIWKTSNNIFLFRSVQNLESPPTEYQKIPLWLVNTNMLDHLWSANKYRFIFILSSDNEFFVTGRLK